jgi:hypothetical protein
MEITAASQRQRPRSKGLNCFAAGKDLCDYLIIAQTAELGCSISVAELPSKQFRVINSRPKRHNRPHIPQNRITDFEAKLPGEFDCRAQCSN